MRTDERRHFTWIAAGCALALLALVPGSARAAVPSTTAYHFSEHPMIAGTVVSVNDHEMVVDTDQGEQVTLQIDSRTMAPRDLAPGMIMRAEFLALEDCRFYAQRILPIRGGMATNRVQAYAAPSVEPQVTAESRSPQPRATGEPSSGATLAATPTTRDYQHSTRPMISGRVVSVNDHYLLVETDQGRQVGLVMDSRTMVPAEVTPGSFLRAEFSQMKDGRHYAQRVSRSVGEVADREQAYAHTRDSELMIARTPDECGFVSAGSGEKVTSASGLRGEPATAAPVVAEQAAEPLDESPETLPQTASRQPLILVLGLSALVTAGLLTAARGFKNV